MIASPFIFQALTLLKELSLPCGHQKKGGNYYLFTKEKLEFQKG